VQCDCPPDCSVDAATTARSHFVGPLSIASSSRIETASSPAVCPAQTPSGPAGMQNPGALSPGERPPCATAGHAAARRLDVRIPLSERPLHRLLNAEVPHYYARCPQVALGPGVPQPPSVLPVVLQAHGHYG
jgi:hypothetical protein